MEVGGGGSAVVAEGAAGDRAARKEVSEVGGHAMDGVKGVAAYAERVRLEGVVGWWPWRAHQGPKYALNTEGEKNAGSNSGRVGARRCPFLLSRRMMHTGQWTLR